MNGGCGLVYGTTLEGEQFCGTITRVSQAVQWSHRGIGLRKLARRSYEVRVHLQWRVVFIHDDDTLAAYDVMNHDEVALWLRGKRK